MLLYKYGACCISTGCIGIEPSCAQISSSRRRPAPPFLGVPTSFDGRTLQMEYTHNRSGDLPDLLLSQGERPLERRTWDEPGRST